MSLFIYFYFFFCDGGGWGGGGGGGGGGIHVIIPSHCVMDSSPFKKLKFKERTKWPKLFKIIKKNPLEKHRTQDNDCLP